MKRKIFLQKSMNVFTENRLLKGIMFILAAAVVFNSFMVYRAVKYQRVILIPPKMTGTVEFVQGKPTETYIKDIARRIVNLAATYSPPLARAQFDDLLSYFAPESYPEERERWYSLAGRIEDSQVSSVFYLEKISLKKNIIEVFGNLKQYAQDNTLLEPSAKTYVIAYRIQDGRFYMKSFKEKIEENSLEKKK